MTDLPDIHHRDRQTGRVQDPEAHARAVRGMFARISGVYDRMNHLASINLDRQWRRRLAARLAPDTGTVLDLCAGTGDLGLACVAAGRAHNVIAVDFVPEMLAGIAGKKGAERVVAVAGDGLRLAQGVGEMLRVLRPGGQVLVLEFFRADPAAVGDARGPAAPVRWALGRALPALGRVVARDQAAYTYLPGSMDRFLGVDEYLALLAHEGCTDLFAERMTLGVAHLVGGTKAAPRGA